MAKGRVEIVRAPAPVQPPYTVKIELTQREAEALTVLTGRTLIGVLSDLYDDLITAGVHGGKFTVNHGSRGSIELCENTPSKVQPKGC